jgi:hypothetical protein
MANIIENEYAIFKLNKAKAKMLAYEEKLKKVRNALHKIPKVKCQDHPLADLILSKSQKLHQHMGHSSDRVDIQLDENRALCYYFSQDGSIGVTVINSSGCITNWNYDQDPTTWTH